MYVAWLVGCIMSLCNALFSHFVVSFHKKKKKKVICCFLCYKILSMFACLLFHIGSRSVYPFCDHPAVGHRQWFIKLFGMGSRICWRDLSRRGDQECSRGWSSQDGQVRPWLCCKVLYYEGWILLFFSLFWIPALNVSDGKFKLPPKETIFVSQRSVHTVCEQPAGKL